MDQFLDEDLDVNLVDGIQVSRHGLVLILAREAVFHAAQAPIDFAAPKSSSTLSGSLNEGQSAPAEVAVGIMKTGELGTSVAKSSPHAAVIGRHRLDDRPRRVRQKTQEGNTVQQRIFEAIQRRPPGSPKQKAIR